MPRHASEIEKNPDSSAALAEKAPDFAELQRQKEELFREIGEQSLKLGEYEKQYLVSLVSGHSIKDGFEFAKRVGLADREDIFEAMVNRDVVFKNKRFFETFMEFLDKNKSYVEKNHRNMWGDSVHLKAGIERIQKILLSDYDKEVKKSYIYDYDTRAKNFLKVPPEYIARIDDYYSHFIRNRRVKSPELSPNELTKVEMTAEDHLRSNEAMLEESYYTGPIREMIGIDTETGLLAVQKKDTGGWLDEEQVWKLRGDIINRRDLDGVIARFDWPREEVEKVLHKARYAPSKLLFEERKREAIDGLLYGRTQAGLSDSKKPYTEEVGGIKQSLIKRGFKEEEFEIKQNEKGEYEVVEKEGENESVERQESVENREGLKLIEDIPLEIKATKLAGLGSAIHTLKLNEVDMVDGEAYSIYNERSVYYGLTLKKGQIVCEGGNGEKGIRKVGDDVVIFQSSIDFKRSRWSVLNSRIIGSNFDAVKESGIEKIGESYYWVGTDSGSSAVKEREEGNYKIIKDNVDESGSHNLKSPPKLYTIGGKLCYINEWKSGKSRIFYDNEPVGEACDDIKLCENSKDKLIFYARKGDEHFVYVDGVENKLPVFDLEIKEFQEILNIKEEKDIFYFKFRNIDGSETIFSSSDLKGGTTYRTWFKGHRINNFSEVLGKPFYISHPISGPDGIHWGYRSKDVSFNTIGHQSVGFGDGVFITDGDRILSLKNTEDIVKEINFNGPVELINSGGKLFIIESLADKKRVWEYDERGELKLNEREQRDLELANAVASEDLQTIKNYFKEYEKRRGEGWLEPIKYGIKQMLQQSRGFVGAVNQTIKEAPELFMDTFRAKDDKDVIYTNDFMSRMFYYMFPEAQANRERALEEEKRKGLFGGLGGVFGGVRSEKDSTMNYDQGVEGLASVDESGYYEMVKANREVLKLREPLPPSTFIVSGIFGNHTESGWTKVNIPLNQEIQDPAKETTFEFVDEKASQTINLPRIAGAKIITERLKGITSKNKEVPVKILEENNLGEVRVDKGKEAKRLTYSQSFSEAPKTMAEVTQRDYEKFRKDFERSFGNVMTKPIGDLGDELDVFVRGLKDKSPREQVIAIQEFCYEYGYYNLDKEPRDTNNFEERLSIMEGRMDDLKEKDPKLAHKLYAGICTDFATLTTALLRKAGFVSGISTGFVPEAGSTLIKTDRAHAVSYVLWPCFAKASQGKPDMIIVDGTPSSITPKIVEQEKKAQEIHKELGVDAEKELAQLEHILKTMDVEAIKKLDNGKLEQTLNHILYGVKQSHVDVMNRVLNASRYAGFDILEMTRGSLEDQIEFRKFLEEEIHKEKSASHENRERRGEELFNTMLEFTRRFSKDKNVHGKDEALDVLDKIFDMSRRYLDPIEERSAAAVVTYLRARKMR